ncbi:MAG: hypothetical protein AB1416_03420 [Actinomycetota bacterium]
MPASRRVAFDRRNRPRPSIAFGGPALNDATLAYVLLFSITSAIGIAIAIWIAASTRKKGAKVDTEALAHREKGWLFLAAGSLAVVLLFTIFLVPYGKSAGPNKQVVNVTGQQFAFVLQPNAIKANTPTEFRLASKDVTHGFGVFDPDGDFLFQGQIIPEHTSVSVWTFTEPGTYKVVCFEFCGAGHHDMLGQFEVTE